MIFMTAAPHGDSTLLIRHKGHGPVVTVDREVSRPYVAISKVMGSKLT